MWRDPLPPQAYQVGELYSIPFPDPPLTLTGLSGVTDDPLVVYIKARLLLGLVVATHQDPDAIWIAPVLGKEQLGPDFDELYRVAQAGGLPSYYALDPLPHLEGSIRVVLLTAPLPISGAILASSGSELLEAMTTEAMEQLRAAFGRVMP
jgi:hypothetical protein